MADAADRRRSPPTGSPKRYHDTYTEELRARIEAKADGADTDIQDDEPEPSADIVDLTEALAAQPRPDRGQAAPSA